MRSSLCIALTLAASACAPTSPPSSTSPETPATADASPATVASEKAETSAPLAPGPSEAAQAVVDAKRYIPELGKYHFKTGWSGADGEEREAKTHSDPAGVCVYWEKKVDICYLENEAGVLSFVPGVVDEPAVWLPEGARVGETWSDGEGVIAQVRKFGVQVKVGDDRLSDCIRLMVHFPEEASSRAIDTFETVCPGRGAVLVEDSESGGKTLLSYRD